MAIAPPIVVGREPWSLDMALETRICDEDHAILPWVPWIESLRDRVGNPRLFVMWNRVMERFSIAHWVWGPMDECPPCVRVASELEGFVGVPGQWPWPEGLMAWNVLVQRMKPWDGVTLRQQLARRRAAKAERTRRNLAKRDDVADHLQKSGMETTARLMRRSPYTADGEGREEAIEKIARVASERTVVGVGAKP